MKTETKMFEPGPWVLGGCSGRMVVKPGYGDIADVDTSANAALIVVAPEMLSALKDLCAVAQAFKRNPAANDPVREQLPIALEAAYSLMARIHSDCRHDDGICKHINAGGEHGS